MLNEHCIFMHGTVFIGLTKAPAVIYYIFICHHHFYLWHFSILFMYVVSRVLHAGCDDGAMVG